MADTTKWVCKVDPASKKATLTVARTDLQNGTPYTIALKGVCYSPAPLNGRTALLQRSEIGSGIASTEYGLDCSLGTG